MNNRENQGGALSRRPQSSLSRGQNMGMWTDPWREMEEMRRRMDAVFGRFFGADLPDIFGRWGQVPGQPSSRVAEPDMDIYENDSEYVIHAALPGVNPQDIRLEATEESIQLTAETRSSMEEPAPALQGDAQTGQQPMTQHRQSRYSSVSRFQFAYTLPTEIDPNQVRADFRNGRLELHLPKQQPTARRSISVPIQSEGSPQALGGATGPKGTASGTMQEGAPANKMGHAYTPAASEDHAAQAAAAGERREGHVSREGHSSAAGGSTNPTQTHPATGAAKAGSKASP